jgi:hypothetical protein
MSLPDETARLPQAATNPDDNAQSSGNIDDSPQPVDIIVDNHGLRGQ